MRRILLAGIGILALAVPAWAAVHPRAGSWSGTRGSAVLHLRVDRGRSTISGLTLRARQRCTPGGTSTATFRESGRQRISKGLVGSRSGAYLRFTSSRRVSGRLRHRSQTSTRSCDTGWVAVSASWRR